MLDYCLYVFDASRHRDLIPEMVEDVEVVRKALDQLYGREDGPNPRFTQLGKYLGQKNVLDKFPVFDPQKSEGQKFIWRRNPEHVLREWKGAVWQPECGDEDRLGSFIGLLLMLSRHLGLDIYDAMLDIYVPANGMPLPQEGGSRYRLGLDSGAAEVPGLALPLSEESAQRDFSVPSDSQVPTLQDWSPKRDQDGEWEQYPLYVFDVRQHSDLNISGHLEKKNLAALEQAVRQLRLREGKTNPYFRRLGKVLARRLSENGFWHTNPENELAFWTLAAWQPKLLAPRRIEELLHVLLPLARRLELHVFDAFQRIYLPGQSRLFAEGVRPEPDPPIPIERGETFRRIYDPDYLQEQRCFEEIAYSSFFEEPLTAALGEHGFRKEPSFDVSKFKFVRSMDSVEQRILISLMDVRCSPYLDMESDRIRHVLERWGKNISKYRGVPFVDSVFYIPFDAIRAAMQPDWKNREFISFVMTQEDADWLIEDLLQHGLPLLDRARTVGGMDWLYNKNPVTARYIRDVGLHVTSPEPFFGRARLATIYARLAGNPAFDEIARDFGKFMEILPDYRLSDSREDNRVGMTTSGRIDDNGGIIRSACVYRRDDNNEYVLVNTEVDSEGRITRSCYRRYPNGNTVPEEFPPSEFSREYAELVDLCRTDLEPVDGNDPA
jgi:hypothetical protein